MKKRIALLLAIVFVVALFAGCGGTTTNSGTTNSGTATENSGTAESGNTTNTGSTNTESGTTTEPTEPTTEPEGGETAPVDEGPYHFAKGHFEYNADGYVDEAYEYELPLSTTDEVFSYWTTCWTPQYLPEDGWQKLETMAAIEEMTGVHMEYDAVSSETRSENFSVLLAADDLRDIMDQANYFYTGTARSMIEDDWFINFYDYRDYMPNYLFNLWDRDDIDVLKYGRVDDTTWPTMYGMLIDPAPGSGYMLREDIMDDLGLGLAKDIKTFDQWHDVLAAFKANGVQWPMAIYSSIELTGGYGFSGYNTALAVTSYGLPHAKLLDGQIRYCLSTDDDRDAISMIHDWFAEGLIDPNYAGYSDATDHHAQVLDGTLACIVANPAGVDQSEQQIDDPDARLRPTPRIRKTEGQILQYGLKESNFHLGSASVSANCENIPLVCTWLDWKWSPTGIIQDNWGVEGLIWEYNDAGERQLTDFVLHNPDGLGAAWVMVLYTNDGLRQPCLNMHRRMYAYPGGEVLLGMFDTWAVPDYGGEYDVPTGVPFTDEEQDDMNAYTNDLVTYISENFLGFIDGSKPISEWDSYVADLGSFGIHECEAIYQTAYERYISE